MAIDAIVTRIQLPLDEPGIIAVFKTASMRGLEIALPREQLSCEATPEGVRVLDGLFVQSLVVLEAVEMRF